MHSRGVSSRAARVALVAVVLGGALLSSVAHSEAESAATHFTFEKKGVLIPSPEGVPAPGPYYPVLVKMDGVADFPYDYALYFSTDHHNGDGGIWLYLCNGAPSEPENWIAYEAAVARGDFDYLEKKPSGNPIYKDTTQGRQTETPCVNIIDGTVFMTYHNAGAGHNQSTLLATSPDGLNFTRIHGEKNSIVLDYDAKNEVGDGHTGYFRWRPNVFPGVGYAYSGFALHGGGDDFHGSMWASKDAVHWTRFQIFDSIEGHAVEAPNIVRRRSIDPNSITPLGNGEFVALCALGNRASGTTPRRLQLYEVFLGSDGRELTRQCRKVLGNGPEGAPDFEELGQPTTAVIDGVWHLIYVGARNDSSVNTLMSAVGRLNLDAPKSVPLAPEERRRDLRGE